jgi:hypothetical protein
MLLATSASEGGRWVQVEEGCRLAVPPNKNDEQFSSRTQVHKQNDIVSSQLAQEGVWEVSSVMYFKEVLLKYAAQNNRPSFFVDVGANSARMSDSTLFADLKVIAFEPIDRNRQLLRTSLCLNSQKTNRYCASSSCASQSHKLWHQCTCPLPRRWGPRLHAERG